MNPSPLIQRHITALLVTSLMITSPTYAFWGIGDVTFDPTSYGELVANGQKLSETYKAATQQLDRLDKMQQTIREANESYERLTNIDLNAMADELNPGKYLKYANNQNGFRMMRAALTNLKTTSEKDLAFINGQLSRIEDLESVVSLQSAAASNTKQATTDLDVRKSSQISAQSTSVLAALAAAEEQRRQQAAMALSQERQQQSDLISESAKLYSTMKSNKTRQSGSNTR